ncbi:MAG: autotransporter outer membrane beta-barrel domain-containing protein, partial [Humidesulfovibrio sp.]|nr:autotransporter outer membrane beta-barrel domain-containing protein [Humidesulfovibrio sp.]
MKANTLALSCVCLLVLALPLSVLAAGGPGPNEPAVNQEAQASTTSTVGSVAATASAGAISSRITTRTGSGGGSGGGGSGGSGGGQSGTGQSSGDTPAGIGVWALGGANFLDNIKNNANYNGSLMTATVGMDKLFGSLLVGVGFGFEKLDLTTKYNEGKMLYDGFSIIPYVSYSITNDLVADASFSYVWLDYTMKDTQTGVVYSDQMAANRMVTTAGLTQYLSMDKFLLSGRLGTMYLNEHQGSYQLNTSEYGKSGIYTWQGSLGLRGTYDMGAFKPFLGATYMHDFLKSGAKTTDMWGSDFDLGFSYNVTESF